MLEQLLRHIRSAHPEIGIWCIPQDDLVIEVNTGQSPTAHRQEARSPETPLADDAGTTGTSGYGTLKFRGSFVQPQEAQEGQEAQDAPFEHPESVKEGSDQTRSEDFQDPDSTDERTDSTVSSEELELLFRDSDEDHEDGVTDSETSEDSGP